MGANMELNDLQQENNHSKVRIAPLGFEADAVEKLEKIFQRDRPGQRAYTTVYPYNGEIVEILLVNYDHPPALEEKDIIIRNHCPDVQIVAASQGALSDETIIHHIHPYQVHGILLAARLLSVLDKVADSPASKSPAEVQASESPKTIDSASEVSTEGYCALVVDDSVSIQKSLELN